MYKVFTKVIDSLVGWCSMDSLVLIAAILIEVMIVGALIINLRGRTRLKEGYFPSRTRRNFIYGLAFLFTVFSVIFILISFDAVGVAAFALPIVMLFFAFFVESVFTFFDDRKGVRICMCQCSSDNQGTEKKQVKVIAEKAKQSESQKETTPKILVKQEAARKNEAKRNKNEKMSEKVEKPQVIAIKAEQYIAAERERAIQEELQRKDKFEQERERLALLAKQLEEQKASAVAFKAVKSKKSEPAKTKSVKAESIKIEAMSEEPKKKSASAPRAVKVKSAPKTKPAKITAVKSKPVKVVEVKPAQIITTTQSVSSKPIQVAEKNQVSEAKVEIVKNTALSTNQRMESLSQKLSAIREINTVVTETKNTVDRTIKVESSNAQVRKNVISDTVNVNDKAISVKREANQVKATTEKRTGKYDENEVQNALASLMKSMSTASQRNENE